MAIIIMAAALVPAQMLLNSCQQEEGASTSEASTSHSMETLRFFLNQGTAIAEETIVAHPARKNAPSHDTSYPSSQYEMVGVEYTSTPTASMEKMCDEVETLDDLEQFQIASQAILHFDERELEQFNIDRQIPIDRAKLLNTLQPLIKQSKDYLASKGFAETEIQEMLDENGVEEYTLIALTMIVAEDEFKTAKEEQNFQSQHGIKAMNNVFNPFCTPCYAIDKKTVDKTIRCAVKALGADIIHEAAVYGITHSSFWTKAAIKQVFKLVAKRAFVAIGIAWAVYDFYKCMG